jgi:hypothetical protein
MENLENCLKNYFLKREINLEEKIIAGAYISANGKIKDFNGVKRYKIENITTINYKTSCDGIERNLSLSNTGEVRNTQAINKSDFVDLPSLITKDLYKYGNKTKVLNTIINTIFGDEIGLKNNYMPKEIMNMIEKMSNNQISFTDINSNVYINPNTFRRVYYNIKKKAISDNNLELNGSSDFYKLGESLKKQVTYIIQQKGVNDNDLIDVDFNNLSDSSFNIITPSLNKLKKK